MATEVGTIGATAAPGVDAAVSGERTIAQAGEVRLARLESLRGIGVLGVMLGHTWLLGQIASGHASDVSATFLQRIPFSGGYGLSLFFALSGYLLYWPFAQRDFGRGGTVDVRNYARNRAFRILPLYYVVLVTLMIVQEHGGIGVGQWLRFIFFAQNFSQWTIETVDGPMWSLVVELHYYILLPLLAYFLGRVSRGDRRVGGVILLALGLISYKLNAHYTAIDQRWALSLPTQFLYLAAGMLVAVLRTAWKTQLPSWMKGPLARADFWLVCAFGLWLYATYDYTYAGFTAIGGGLIVGACVLPLKPGLLLRGLDWRWLAFLGIVSYSFYLWHLPLFSHIDGRLHSFPALLLVGGPLSIVVATISYRLIEEPFLKLRKRWSPDAAAQRASR